MAARPSTPPTAPPTIAPVLEEFEEGFDAAAVGSLWYSDDGRAEFTKARGPPREDDETVLAAVVDCMLWMGS